MKVLLYNSDNYNISHTPTTNFINIIEIETMSPRSKTPTADVFEPDRWVDCHCFC